MIDRIVDWLDHFLQNRERKYLNARRRKLEKSRNSYGADNSRR